MSITYKISFSSLLSPLLMHFALLGFFTYKPMWLSAMTNLLNWPAFSPIKNRLAYILYYKWLK
jgi:hypothetical protein